MNSGLIVTRYVKALLTSSEEQGESLNIYKLMSTLVDSFAQHNTLQSVLKNPTLSIAQKKELITVASGNFSNTLFELFIDLLLKNRREDFLQRIALNFCDLYRKDFNICMGKLVTAVPLDKKTEEAICAFLRKHSQQEVELKTVIDANILGGFILDVEEERLDASIAGQLHKIRKNLVK